MRQIIVTASYMLSGSSAMTDLISEFKNVNNKHKEFEYVFLHCPNGVFDLEDKLLIGNNSNRSDEAIHSFRDTMKDLYDKKFYWPGYYKNIISEDFMDIVDEYIDSIVDVKTDSFWYYQENPTNSMKFKAFIYALVIKLTNNKVVLKKPLRYKTMLLSYISSEEFYDKTKIFINNVINRIDPNTDEDILLDQLLLPHNAFRVNNYFDDNLKMIIIERDPRDVFLLNKYVLNAHCSVVPYSFDVEKFCKQFKDLRRIEKESKYKGILRVRFEDLIYDYENTRNKVLKFLGYKKEDHINQFSRFDPKKSIKNTQIFKKDEKYKRETEYIEKELKEFLYDFPKEDN